jgi:hypothetical protein
MVAEAGDELKGQVGVVVVIDASQYLLCVPSGAYFATWISGVEEADQPTARVLIEAFISSGEQPTSTELGQNPRRATEGGQLMVRTSTG